MHHLVTTLIGLPFVVLPLLIGWVFFSIIYKAIFYVKNRYQADQIILTIASLPIISLLWLIFFSFTKNGNVFDFFNIPAGIMVIIIWNLAGDKAEWIANYLSSSLGIDISNLLISLSIFIYLLWGWIGIEAIKKVRPLGTEHKKINIFRWFIAIIFIGFILFMVFIAGHDLEYGL